MSNNVGKYLSNFDVVAIINVQHNEHIKIIRKWCILNIYSGMSISHHILFDVGRTLYLSGNGWHQTWYISLQKGKHFCTVTVLWRSMRDHTNSANKRR